MSWTKRTSSWRWCSGAEDTWERRLSLVSLFVSLSPFLSDSRVKSGSCFSHASSEALWMAVTVCQSVSWSTTVIVTTFGADIHGRQTINPKYFGDPLTSSSSASMRLTRWVLSEMQQPLDGLPWNLGNKYTCPSSYIVIHLVMPWLFM